MIGQMVLEDYLTEGVLERLLRYERRIENSLYRTLKELRTIYDRSHTPDPQLEATLARWREEDGEAKKARIFARCEAAKAQAAAVAEGTATNEMCETKPKEESFKCEERGRNALRRHYEQVRQTNPIWRTRSGRESRVSGL